MIITRTHTKNKKLIYIKVAVDSYSITMGENSVSAHDAPDPDDAPAPLFIDDQRRISKLARLFQRTGL